MKSIDEGVDTHDGSRDLVDPDTKRIIEVARLEFAAQKS
jgi:hypothetical protein